MRVRTDFGVLATAVVVASVLSVALHGDGHFFKEGVRGRPDDYVFTGLRGGISYVVLFFLFHLGLRKANIGGTAPGRWAYAGIGAIAAVIMDAAFIPLDVWSKLAHQGAISIALATVAIFGAMLGFIYHWRAGLDAEGDDPAALEAALAASGEPLSPSVAAAEPASITVGQEEYFRGPLQVRTSLPVMAVAALTGAGLCALGQYVVQAGVVTVNTQLGAQTFDLRQALADSAQSITGGVVLLAIVGPLPFAVLGLLGHLGLRGLKQSSPAAYGAAGVLIPAVLTLPLSMGGSWGFVASVCVGLAVVMSIYRSMAGLEPVPVKEDIILNDHRNLVGAHHVRRQFGRVIKA